MAYTPYYPNGYQPQFNYPSQFNTQPSQMGVGANPSNTQSALIWVQGEAGANSYLVAPNQTVTLWDSEAQIIYLKSADASGMPSIKVLDYTIRDNTAQKPNIQPQTDFATKSEVIALQKEINALKSKFGERKEGKK